MSEQHLYEFSVIRLVPKVEREEFLNVGIILFCKRQKYLRVKLFVNQNKLQVFTNGQETNEIQQTLKAFENIAHGKKDCGPIALLEVTERFRWLTAVRSSSIQTSRPHPGLTQDLDHCLDRLFEELVM